MERDRFGLIGGLVAERPLLTSLVLAFGLSALVAVGVAGSQTGDTSIAGDLVIAALALVVAPLFIAGAAPRSIGLQMMIGLAAAAAAGSAYVYGPVYLGVTIAAISAMSFTALTWILLASARLVGPMTKFAFIAAGAGALGAAGALGLMLRENVAIAAGAPAILAGLAVAAYGGAGAIADFAASFAGGVDRRRSAGLAARRAAAPSFYGAVAAAIAFGGAASPAGVPGAAMFGALAGLAVVLCAVPAFAAPAAALSLRRASETLAVEENHRRQSFRRFWRPFRRLFPANASLAMIAIAAIAVLAASLNSSAGPPALELVYAGLCAAAAGLIFFSLRAGLFVFFMLIVSSTLAGWLWRAMGAPALSPLDQAAALTLAASLFGGFAATWRDARSPRLNPRETTEAGMMDALGEHFFGAVLAVAAFLAGRAAGAWPGGLAASGFLALTAAIGLLLAPPLMTALSGAVRRELA